MAFTEVQLTKTQRDFTTRKRRYLALAVTIVALALALSLSASPCIDSYSGSGRPRFGYVAIQIIMGQCSGSFLGLPALVWLILVVVVLVLSYINWRCPNCGALLGRRLSPSNCTNCGIPLQPHGL